LLLEILAIKKEDKEIGISVNKLLTISTEVYFAK
jgi:hypothetical protein